jgi:hypothetical protein
MKFSLLILVLSICPLPALADADITKSVWLGATALDFDYEEFDGQDNSLDREKGWLPGVTAGASIEGHRWFVESGLLWSSGRVDYDSPAVDSKTDEEILNLEVLAGTPLFASDRQRVSLVAGVGHRNWQRDIRSPPSVIGAPKVLGLDETYRWHYWLLGLRGEHEFNSRTRIVANVQVTRTANPEIEVEFKENFADDVNLDLGEETAFKVSLAVQRQLGGGASLWLSPWYERWDLGRSKDKDLYLNGVPIGTVWEPRSETRNYGISLGVRWQFGGS